MKEVEALHGSKDQFLKTRSLTIDTTKSIPIRSDVRFNLMAAIDGQALRERLNDFVKALEGSRLGSPSYEDEVPFRTWDTSRLPGIVYTQGIESSVDNSTGGASKGEIKLLQVKSE